MPRYLKIAILLTCSAALVAGFMGAGLWSMSQKPGYCGYCHVMKPYYRSWMSSGNSAHRHALASITCQTCHPRSIRQLAHEIVTTIRGTYREPLPAMRIGKEQCLACHGSYAALAQATAGLDNNPHASHIGEEECYKCHAMHRESQGMKYCVTCHHTGQFIRCNNCHKDR